MHVSKCCFNVVMSRNRHSVVADIVCRMFSCGGFLVVVDVDYLAENPV